MTYDESCMLNIMNLILENPHVEYKVDVPKFAQEELGCKEFNVVMDVEIEK